MTFKIFSPVDPATLPEKHKITKFLYEHLDEYGDSEKSIMNSLDYALSPYPLAGGFILLATEGEDIAGAVVMNKTGMKGYIPENILVYIAVHRAYRGDGLGKELMQRSIDEASGDIALHVEPENPAKFLYEKFDFTNKYLEMRFVQPGN